MMSRLPPADHWRSSRCLDEVVKKITEIFAFDSVTYFLFDAQTRISQSCGVFRCHQGGTLSPRAFRRGQGLTGRVAESGEPVIFENVKTDPRYHELSQTRATQQRDFCFFAIFPIKSKEQFFGTINCIGKKPRKLIAEEVRLISSMCDQIGVAVENINLFEASSQQNRGAGILQLGTARGSGTANGDQRNPARHRQLADGYSAGARYGGGECGSTLRSR